MIKPIERFLQGIKALSSKAYGVFDVRDFFVFGGLGMLGYGLYLKWGEGVALIVCGVLLMAIGYLMRDE
ncbi:MAG: hypothetical protein JRE23_02805 [Deltaproteobacteria bacterium]|nr:hypothetical protein [Deltaproteobacteria bacterium]